MADDEFPEAGVLRMQAGDMLLLTDAEGLRARAEERFGVPACVLRGGIGATVVRGGGG